MPPTESAPVTTPQTSADIVTEFATLVIELGEALHSITIHAKHLSSQAIGIEADAAIELLRRLTRIVSAIGADQRAIGRSENIPLDRYEKATIEVARLRALFGSIATCSRVGEALAVAHVALNTKEWPAAEHAEGLS